MKIEIFENRVYAVDVSRHSFPVVYGRVSNDKVIERFDNGYILSDRDIIQICKETKSKKIGIENKCHQLYKVLEF